MGRREKTNTNRMGCCTPTSYSSACQGSARTNGSLRARGQKPGEIPQLVRQEPQPGKAPYPQHPSKESRTGMVTRDKTGSRSPDKLIVMKEGQRETRQLHNNKTDRWESRQEDRPPVRI